MAADGYPEIDKQVLHTHPAVAALVDHGLSHDQAIDCVCSQLPSMLEGLEKRLMLRAYRFHKNTPDSVVFRHPNRVDLIIALDFCYQAVGVTHKFESTVMLVQEFEEHASAIGLSTKGRSKS